MEVEYELPQGPVSTLPQDLITLILGIPQCSLVSIRSVRSEYMCTLRSCSISILGLAIRFGTDSRFEESIIGGGDRIIK